MATDAELNESVARKLGWTEVPGSDGRAWLKNNDPVDAHVLPDYCHSIAAAWEIVNYCQNNSDNFYLDWEDKPLWTCQLGIAEEQAATAPMAICLAFLEMEDK